MSPERHYDVVVAGGGPAGAATAIGLSRAGVKTLILDRRAERSEDRIGESLPPSAGVLLDRLGVRAAFNATNPRRCFGNRAAWGGPTSDYDFIRHPQGPGWHLDRARFDRMLVEAAVQAGSEYSSGARMAVVSRPNQQWQLVVEQAGHRFLITAEVVVDATGRASAFARRAGARRRVVDRLIAVVAFLTTPLAASPHSMTLVEAVPEGWWYTAVLPDGRLASAFMTDPDLPAAHAARTPEGWRTLLAMTTETMDRVDSHGYQLTAPPRIVGAGSSRLDRIAGDGWLAVGDAAASHDPLSSHGIAAALSGGLDAATAVQAYLGGSAAAFDAYSERVRSSYAMYLWMWLAYYGEEHRWPHSTFWRRRHEAAAPQAESGLYRRYN